LALVYWAHRCAVPLKDLGAMEGEVLSRLEFNLSVVTPLFCLAELAETERLSPVELSYCQYLLELALLSSSISSCRPSYQAASALALAGRVLGTRSFLPHDSQCAELLFQVLQDRKNRFRIMIDIKFESPALH
jgi:hypothetical protein